MREITLLELLKNGVHFGHQTAKWHPKMKPFIFSARNGVHIINLEMTAVKLGDALAYVRTVAQRGGTVLFVGTKRQAKDTVKQCAVACGMPYVTERWLGGTFTNFGTIGNLTKKLKELKQKFLTGEMDKYSKKEKLQLLKEKEKLEKLVGGIETITKLPDAVFIIDIKEEKTVLKEAQRKKIPTIALVDTNANPEEVDFPIPANDDAIKSITLLTSLIAEAIEEGKSSFKDKEKKRKEEVAAGTEPGKIEIKKDVIEKVEEIEETTGQVAKDKIIKV